MGEQRQPCLGLQGRTLASSLPRTWRYSLPSLPAYRYEPGETISQQNTNTTQPLQSSEPQNQEERTFWPGRDVFEHGLARSTTAELLQCLHASTDAGTDVRRRDGLREKCSNTWRGGLASAR